MPFFLIFHISATQWGGHDFAAARLPLFHFRTDRDFVVLLSPFLWGQGCRLGSALVCRRLLVAACCAAKGVAREQDQQSGTDRDGGSQVVAGHLEDLLQAMHESLLRPTEVRPLLSFHSHYTSMEFTQGVSSARTL